jgi:low temperature requirement protein LtrA
MAPEHDHADEHRHHVRTLWYRRMVPRNVHEDHRAATPLELFFDLCFVVAIALAAAGLHHEIAEDRVWNGVSRFAFIFWGIWWAWMNFTWFASAYDTDDVVYRLTTMVQMAGALVFAAGVPRVFEEDRLVLATIGYVVMRLALVVQWLRAAVGDEGTHQTALRYAMGVAFVQLLWIGRLFLPESLLMPAFAMLVVVELLIPVWGENAGHTTWHPRHIGERYGLFTIIVLGETILAATVGFQEATAEGDASLELILIAIGGLAIVFSMWWLYFEPGEARLESTGKYAFEWGYGHYFVFASAAAVGAGLQVALDYETHVAHTTDLVASMAVAVPVAVYLLSVWVLRVLPAMHGPIVPAVPACAALILIATLVVHTTLIVGAVLVVLVALMIAAARKHEPA